MVIFFCREMKGEVGTPLPMQAFPIGSSHLRESGYRLNLSTTSEQQNEADNIWWGFSQSKNIRAKTRRVCTWLTIKNVGQISPQAHMGFNFGPYAIYCSYTLACNPRAQFPHTRSLAQLGIIDPPGVRNRIHQAQGHLDQLLIEMLLRISSHHVNPCPRTSRCPEFAIDNPSFVKPLHIRIQLPRLLQQLSIRSAVLALQQPRRS